jgi:hypothetical protein
MSIPERRSVAMSFMNQRERDALDRHITGNYGEDYFKKPMKKKNDEHHIQAACIKWAFLNRNNFPLEWLFAIPNGGKRNVITAMMMKREGVRKGVADLFLPYPMNGKYGLFIETKTPIGTLSPDQLAFKVYVELRGYAFAVVRSVDEFETVIRKYFNGTI